MSFVVAALYQFVPLPDFRALREPLRSACAALDIRGSLLLAAEGLNGTVAGQADAIKSFIDDLRHGPLFGGRLDNLELKLSTAADMPFQRLKVRLKKEIVTLGDEGVDPSRLAGTPVDPRDWNALIGEPDVLVLDTRNAFEVAMGTFAGATDPQIASFGQFRAFVDTQLDPARHRRVAMFCTGGIRCEKASSFMLARGFSEVYQLKGGILKYLETVQQADSRWQGRCFVFDDRVALGHGLIECRDPDDTAASADEQAR